MRIRAGDIVTVQIRVTEVTDYSEEGQQIQGRMLPRGAHVGWLVPQEAKATLDVPQFRVGDEVWLDDAQSARGKIHALVTGKDDTTLLWVEGPEARMQTIAVTRSTRRV